MVACVNGDLYPPFQHQMNIHEEGPQSSEEGSGLHSPVFSSPYSPVQNDTFRYQHDLQQAPSGLLPPHFDYPHHLGVQQAPILDTTRLEHPNPRNITFSSHSYALPQRNQLVDFPVQSPLHSRIPSTDHGGGPVDFRYNNSVSESRRLPGGPSHDHTYPRHGANSTSLNMDADHRQALVASTERAEPSVAGVAGSSRESRKEISSVVIACRQCRGRKIRCDSTRPVCNNCVRRSNVCEYDAVPKRRGPDKRPGTRQRSCKKRPADGSAPPPPKRKRTSTDRPSESRESAPSFKENMSEEGKRSPSQSRHSDRPQEPHPHSDPAASHYQHTPNDLRILTDSAALMKPEFSPTTRRPVSYGYEQTPYTKTTFLRQHDVNTSFQSPHTPHHNFPAISSPGIATEQKTWWDKILRNYNTLQGVVDNMTFLIENTGHLLSFININFLAKRLYNDQERLQIQPSFILAGLALAQLIKSSSVEEGAEGLATAMMLRSDAHQSFQEALSFGWVDATLAEAALILALFESSAYPEYSYARADSALLALDNVIHSISLTTNDSHDPQVSSFAPQGPPVVDIDYDSPVDPHEVRKCYCHPPDAPEPPDHYHNHPYSLPWDNAWTADEIRDEETRRLCWSALSLASSHSAQCAAFNREPPKLHLNVPSNFILLFPGEAMDRVSPAYRAPNSLSPKESIWALYCRSMLLWNFCNCFREPEADPEIKAENAHVAFIEAQAIQDSLDVHRCNLDTTLIYMCREYIYNTRLLVTQALRSLQGLDSGPTTTPGPIFKRKQAEDWLYYQDQVIRRVNDTIHHLHGPQSYQLTRRPFRATWFMNQLAICLILWSHDHSLADALKLAKLILPAIDVMNALWPSPVNRQQSDNLRQQLTDACMTIGLDAPFPPSYTLPSFLTSA